MELSSQPSFPHFTQVKHNQIRSSEHQTVRKMNVQHGIRQMVKNVLQPPYIYPFSYTFVKIGILLQPASVNCIKLDTRDRRDFLCGCIFRTKISDFNRLYLHYKINIVQFLPLSAYMRKKIKSPGIDLAVSPDRRDKAVFLLPDCHSSLSKM